MCGYFNQFTAFMAYVDLKVNKNNVFHRFHLQKTLFELVSESPDTQAEQQAAQGPDGQDFGPEKT